MAGVALMTDRGGVRCVCLTECVGVGPVRGDGVIEVVKEGEK